MGWFSLIAVIVMEYVASASYLSPWTKWIPFFTSYWGPGPLKIKDPISLFIKIYIKKKSLEYVEISVISYVPT